MLSNANGNLRVLTGFDACALEPRRRFVTERGKKKLKFKPRLTAWVNSPSCKPFADFVKKTLLERLQTGAISLKGRISEVELAHLVLLLTFEPSKPRLCHDARFLNLWIMDVPFKLYSITNLPRYVAQNTYQTILDDKSEYDHLLLTEQSRVFFGI